MCVAHRSPELFVRTERLSTDENQTESAQDEIAPEWHGAAAGVAAVLKRDAGGGRDTSDGILTMGGATAFAVAAASSSAELAAFAAAAAAWQSRFAADSQPSSGNEKIGNDAKEAETDEKEVDDDVEMCALLGSDGTGTTGRHCQLTHAVAKVASETEAIYASSTSDEGEESRNNGGIAPLQVAVMNSAYPGTMGNALDFDYAIGDRVSSPPELRATQLSETLLEMPYRCVCVCVCPICVSTIALLCFTSAIAARCL